MGPIHSERDEVADSRAQRSTPPPSRGMSYWRWLLFAAMARLQWREDAYLRIPNAKTSGRNVPIDLGSGSLKRSTPEWQEDHEKRG